MIEQETDRGTTRISARAVTRVAAAVAASHLNLAPDTVGVTLARPDGRIELTVSAPIPAATMIDRVQEQIRQESGDLIGSTIGRVTVRQSSAPQAAALAGTILTRVRSRYREDPVRLVGLVAVGLASVGIVAGILARAISRK
ncbi:hypothetical protein SAMN05216282_12213 [Cryobacterium psychrotolerans]|uniref:Uncharacterized protein n=1 Tax=Cryobacterium psychrotolerans TaxID=386301 RepID=A0A1G9GHP7_9MICO|nr:MULTISPECIES: hypothetical protein [Cryobacterium]TFD45858.1 hypothetical protein E3T33_06295 [Cryobacterium sp. TMT1-2-1]TFD83605.1 hypothetical protein E3T56_12355 [Cryobacterium psychrotolerans]SDL00200.1 hypothetical protein SAMN05216282_12213 [Cryobacterium psychrotolerans]